MDSTTHCAYNLTRDTALSLNVTVANPSREHLKIIETLVDGLGAGSDSALWLNPLSGPPKVPRLFACEVVYLDRDLRVIQGTDQASAVDFPPWNERVESALFLRARTMASTRTQPGDQLTVCDAEALEANRQSFSPPDPVASESSDTNSPDLVSVRASTTEATLLDNSRDTEPPEEPVPQSLDLTPAVSSLPQSSESPQDSLEPSLIPAAAIEAIESSTSESHSRLFARATLAVAQRGNQFTLSQSPIWQITKPTIFIPNPKSEEPTTVEPETGSALHRSAPPEVEPNAEPRSEEPPASPTPIRTSPAETLSSPATSAPVNASREGRIPDYRSDEFAIWRPAVSAAPIAIAKSRESASVQAQTETIRAPIPPATPETVQPSGLLPPPNPILNSPVAEPPAPKTEDEGPAFFSPAPIRFFDPTVEHSAEGDSIESQNRDTFHAEPASRRSNHLSPELQAAILQITEMQKEMGRDRDSLVKSAVAKSKPARDLEPRKERTSPKEPAREPPIAEPRAANRASLATRLRRWLGAGRAPAIHGNRRSKRFSPPGLVAYHWSGGEPRPYRIADISDTGFYLLTSEPWLPHATLRMTLQRTDGDKEAPGQSIAVLARVVRIDKHGAGHEFVMTKSPNRKSGEMLLDDGADRRALARFLQPLMKLSKEIPARSAN
jgi:PilZ domain